jgi:hypothetical protein
MASLLRGRARDFLNLRSIRLIDLARFGSGLEYLMKQIIPSIWIVFDEDRFRIFIGRMGV